ncbi:MAG TPA: cupin domain-containing protein [Ramlibacter sp.]|nr:cupin domain-containing protein [Ramlibacter sp.]
MSNEQSNAGAHQAARMMPTPETARRFLEILQRGQEFHYQHARGEQDFVDGFRSYARYRDLGVSKATGGLVQAHLVRLVGECTDEVRKQHYHDTCFQMVYVLKGWEKIQAEGHEPVTMREGSVWIQPPQIHHVVLDYSDGCEVLEIILPAEFDTVET